MENVIFKYSDFFEDDGGFDKIRKEFDKLADDLIKKADSIKSQIKIFDLDDIESIEEYEKKTEDLAKAFKKYEEAKVKVNKVEKEYLEQKDKTVKSSEEEIDALVKLDKKLKIHRDELKEINTLQKLGIKTDRDLNKERVRAELNIKKVSSQIREQQKEILKTTKLSAKENKLLKAKITLEKTEIRTLDDVRERMKALRIVVQSLDIETQADQIKAFNDEINELTEVLGDNSDQFIKNKINIGNYEEDITNALKGTNAFHTGIGGLDQIISKLIITLTLTNEELEAMEANTAANSKVMGRFIAKWRTLNKVMKASIIGAVLIVLVGVASAFGDTRAGAIRLEKAMSILSTSWTIFSKRVGITFVALKEVSTLLLSGKFEKAGQVWEKAMIDASTASIVATESIVEGLENIERAFEIEDDVKRLTQEIEILNGELSVTQSIADDSSKSLTTQLLASKKALELIEEVSKREVEIARQNLEIANERVKQNIKANSVERENIDLSKEGTEFAQATLDLAQERGASLEISNSLIDAQQQAVLEVIKAENDLQLNREENGKKTREINRDIFEQNLDLLIDLIDTEKNISEALVNNTSILFQKRLNEFNRFVVAFRANAQKELDEFTKEASNLDLDLDFGIEFGEDGDFDVFINGTKLATDNIVELNKQLQEIGLNEIDINRFREFIVESRNGIRDFKLLGKEINLVGINLRQISEDIKVSEGELASLDALEIKIQKLKDASNDGLSPESRKRISEQLIELEKDRTDIIEKAEFDRTQNRIEAIDTELRTVEEGSERYLLLIQERLDLEKQLRQKNLQDTIDDTKENNKEALEDYKKFSEGVRTVLDKVLDKAIEVSDKRVDKSEERVERQGELIDKQRERAESGLTNTLAFEERALGEREAELIKQEKRKERLEKISALYSSYNNYASKGDENPIAKALRDFAILEAISASFGDGGVVEDKLPKDGIFRGQSHRGPQGGIPIKVEGKEGIFSVKEMENLGKENFYKMKDIAGMGKVDSNFFSNQRKSFVKAVPVGSTTDPRLITEMRSVKQAIENKPVESWDVSKTANGIMDLVQSTVTKNKKVRNHYRIKKPRL